jgi:hypothetical protein
MRVTMNEGDGLVDGRLASTPPLVHFSFHPVTLVFLSRQPHPHVHLSARPEPVSSLKRTETSQRIPQRLLTETRKVDECKLLVDGQGADGQGADGLGSEGPGLLDELRAAIGEDEEEAEEVDPRLNMGEEELAELAALQVEDREEIDP